MIDEAAIRLALSEVADPEIPAVSVIDLGMVERVDLADGVIRVELLPTFVGCPAVDMIKTAVAARLEQFGRPVLVETTFRVPWTSDRISAAGRAKLRASGFAPPTEDSAVRCPYCGSGDVALDNLFGPTQCRSLRYCRACRQPFEQFKTV